MKGIQTDCLTLLLLSNTVPNRWKSKFILPICIEAYAYDKKNPKNSIKHSGKTNGASRIVLWMLNPYYLTIWSHKWDACISYPHHGPARGVYWYQYLNRHLYQTSNKGELYLDNMAQRGVAYSIGKSNESTWQHLTWCCNVW